MTTNDIEARIRELPWPRPPQDVRDRILSGASLSTTPVTWSDRVWFSRRWRMTGSVAAVALIAISLWAGRMAPDSALASEPPSVDAAVERFIREAGFPEDVARTMTRRWRAGARPLSIGELRVAFDAIEGGS